MLLFLAPVTHLQPHLHPSQVPGSVFQPLWAPHLSPSRLKVSFQALPKIGGFLESSQGIAILGRGLVGGGRCERPQLQPLSGSLPHPKSSTSFCTNLAILTLGQAWGRCTT